MSSSLKIFSDACQALYAPGLRAELLLERSFNFLETIVPSELIVHGRLNLRNQKLDVGFNTDPDSKGLQVALDSYGRLMHKYPLFNWNPAINDGRPFCRRQFFSRREFRNLDIYCEVFQPLGIDDHCAVYVPTQAGEVTFFGLERSGGADFLPEELTLLEAAQAQLANAHAVVRLMGGGADETVTPASLVEAGLTPREAEVLYWMNQGKTNSEIAIILQIGFYTVKAHVVSIFNKSGVCNRLAAVLWARETCRQLQIRPALRPSILSTVVAEPLKFLVGK
jgi:DNA-binding CsgD family transcriptional regulator